MTTVVIKNRDIYAGNPQLVAPVVAALNDILRQRIGREQAKLLRKIERRVTQQAEEITAEHKRIIELYSPKDEEGKALPLTKTDDLTDAEAFDKEFQELMEDSFEVEAISASLLDGMTLNGATWLAPIVLEDDEPQKKEESAGE